MILATILVSPASAQDIPVAERHQVPIFLKLLTYNRSLMEDDPEILKIAVVYRPDDEDSERNRGLIAEELDAAAGKTVSGVPFERIEIAFRDAGRLERELLEAGVHVVYVAPLRSSHLEAVQQITRRNGILTMTGVADYVEKGISLGIDLEKSKPKILVNLTALASEGQDFKSSVLRLCRVYR